MFKINEVPPRDSTPSAWVDLQPAPSDPVFGLIHFYLKDENPKKILLGVGAYRGDDGKPCVLKSVKEAERRLLETEVEKEYAFPDGLPKFR
jgi:aspartate aminotransferase